MFILGNLWKIILLLLALICVGGLVFLGIRQINKGSGDLSNGVKLSYSKEYSAYDGVLVTGKTVFTVIRSKQNTSTAVIVKPLRANPTIYCAGFADDKPDFEESHDGICDLELNQILNKNGTEVQGLKVSKRPWAELQNKNTIKATDQNNAEYISETATFKAVIIYDKSLEAIGIYFEQQGKHLVGVPLLQIME